MLKFNSHRPNKQEFGMPSQVQSVKVFLSSPGNLREDRELVRKIVSQINIDSGRRDGFYIDLVMWETHTRPSAGEYAQDVINSQIPDDIDIFVGLMGHYFGTPTGKYNSGTEEEFRIAFERWRETQAPEIMFYFSDFANSLRGINAAQLELVQGFKREIAALGVLYNTYSELSEFGYSIRNHLSDAAAAVLKKHKSEDATTVEKFDFLSVESVTHPNYESLIFDDPLIAAIIHLDNATQAANNLTRHMASHSAKLSSFAKEMKKISQKLSSGKVQTDPTYFLRCIHEVSAECAAYQKAIFDFIPNFRCEFLEVILNLQRFLSSLDTIDSQEKKDTVKYVIGRLSELKEAFFNLKGSVKKAVEGFDSWQVDVSDIQQRKKILQALLTDFEELLGNAMKLCDEFVEDTS